MSSCAEVASPSYQSTTTSVKLPVSSVATIASAAPAAASLPSVEVANLAAPNPGKINCAPTSPIVPATPSGSIPYFSLKSSNLCVTFGE